MSDDNELSEYEQLRLRNIKENYLKMLELGLVTEKDDPLQEKTNNIEEKNITRRSRSNLKVKPTESTRIPTRLSIKLEAEDEMTSEAEDEMTFEAIRHLVVGDAYVYQLTKNEYYYDYFGEENDENDSSDESNGCIQTIEDEGFDTSDEEDDDRPKKRKRGESSFDTRKRVKSEPTSPRRFLTPEEITPEMLGNVAEYSTGKTYSQDGTTCHQCRQKTVDQKSICRSSTCSGVRGQFCGPCLKNRYGENVADVLMNPAWECPVCRNICNCSICRNQLGKAPTGPLAPFALSQGFKSVHELLIKEECDDD